MIKKLHEAASETEKVIWQGRDYMMSFADLRDLLLDAARLLKYPIC